MSLVNSILTAGEKVLLACGHGDSFRVLTGAASGISFIARLDVVQVLDADSDLGADPRMQDVIRILPPAPALEVGDIVFAVGKNLKLIKREDNACSITTDFWVEQQI